MQGIKKWLLALVCLVPLAFGGCTVLKIDAAPSAAGPNLGVLSFAPYEGEIPSQAQEVNAASQRVDLWLDATQVMGGIKTGDEGLYQHMSRRYREGGFHYQYDSSVGMYEYLLRDMLNAAEGSFVRLVRYGNERLPADFLISSGLAQLDTPLDTMRSLRRDLMTYAIDPMPTLISEMSSEDMTNSFYSLGTSMLNQMSSFVSGNGAKLESAGMVSQMSAALDTQISTIQTDDQSSLVSIGNDQDYPLLYALNNLDLSRLSVITCDPATIRGLTEITAEGESVKYIYDLLQQRGIFDKGLHVGLYAFTLDYMGQLESFGTADFTEKLLWGRLRYDTKKNITTGLLPMPRVLLALVIGQEAQVSSFTSRLATIMESDINLQGPKGPIDEALAYTANGKTVMQQPFTFSYEYTEVFRPSLGYYTQYTPGMQMQVTDEQSSITDENGYKTIYFHKDQMESTDINISFPASQLPDDITVDINELKDTRVDVDSTLLLTKTMENSPDADVSQSEQVIAHRDTLYIFDTISKPFDTASASNPFTLRSLAFTPDGKTLDAVISVDGTKLQAGYYRLELYADISGEQLTWLPVDWIDGNRSLNASPSNAEIADWETFSALIAEHERTNPRVPRQFVHAWGEATTTRYHDVVIPNFPPVYKAQGLSELYNQILSVANVAKISYIRCCFDVFVTGD